MINHPYLPGPVLVLALKVPCPQKLLSPEQIGAAGHLGRWHINGSEHLYSFHLTDGKTGSGMSDLPRKWEAWMATQTFRLHRPHCVCGYNIPSPTCSKPSHTSAGPWGLAATWVGDTLPPSTS